MITIVIERSISLNLSARRSANYAHLFRQLSCVHVILIDKNARLSRTIPTRFIDSHNHNLLPSQPTLPPSFRPGELNSPFPITHFFPTPYKTLGMFSRLRSSDSTSNKHKKICSNSPAIRPSRSVSRFKTLRSLIGISEIVWQAIAYRKIFSSGYRHLILGKTTIFSAIYVTAGLQRGSFKAICSPTGKRLRPRVPLCGFMGSVR